ncbi:unnamed protein product, partial [Mycena citricolor]
KIPRPDPPLTRPDSTRNNTTAENSAALSNKRKQIVTSPKVDWALGFWVLDMEQKRCSVTGAMLIEQQKRFEEALKIPDNHCLRGTGWLDSF